MMILYALISLFILISGIEGYSSPISPYLIYENHVQLEEDVADLWWTVDSNKDEILFEFHVKTSGWIALGISPAGGMEGADIGLGWVDFNGKVYFQDRYASGYSKPMIDTNGTDWFVHQGQQVNGWTAIQFSRSIQSCRSMDVSIRSGTNILIYAYGLVDPDPFGGVNDITYHGTRRGTKILPLLSYINPPTSSQLNGLETIDFTLNNRVIPSVDTTYHCTIYKVPNSLTIKRHAIGIEYLIDENNVDMVHHMNVYECDPSSVFDDQNLPDDICNNIYPKLVLCLTNAATAWAIGGDKIEMYPNKTGYPMGGDFEIKYYLIQIHYDNPKLISNRVDRTGIRFYLGNELREHEIGFLSFGTDANPYALSIPPGIEHFSVDSYCPSNASLNFPSNGVTVFSAFPHTHLQGRSVWTKIIRNGRAIEYLFNAESFNFNYQFRNLLQKPVQLFQGDEFSTRCVYNTMNKNQVTLGGERTEDEMCFHGFAYYPRMKDLYICLNTIPNQSWQTFLNISKDEFNSNIFKQKLMSIQWNSQLHQDWQNFYDNSPRLATFGRSLRLQGIPFQKLPEYQDLNPDQCVQDK